MEVITVASKKSLTKAAKDKRSFRASTVWKQFRQTMFHQQAGVDLITGSKLPKAFHLHHKLLSADEYSNIGDESHFLACQPTTHKVIHWCLVQIKKLHSLEIIDRLYDEVKREAVLNGFIDEDD